MEARPTSAFSKKASPSKPRPLPGALTPPTAAASLIIDVEKLRHLICGERVFEVDAFVEYLTGGIMGDSVEYSDAKDKDRSDILPLGKLGFDPLALGELFGGTVEGLACMSREMHESMLSTLEKGRRLDAQKKMELDRHHRGLHEVHESIEEVETHFRMVGLTAVRIGQSLLQTECQRRKADHAQRLIENFLAFDTLRYETMLKDAESQRTEMLSNAILAPMVDEANHQAVASMLSDLKVICEDLNAPALENAVRCVRVFGERFERQLLDKFEAAAVAEGEYYQQEKQNGAPLESGLDAARQSAIRAMRDCAASLLKFGDPVKLYNTYIYTIVARQIQALTIQDRHRNEDVHEMRDALSEFFGLVSSLCQEAFTLIRRVFPPTSLLKVTRMLIERMISDPVFGIQVRLADVLDVPSSIVYSSAGSAKPQSPVGLGHENQGTNSQKSLESRMPVSDALDMLLMVHDKTSALATDLVAHCVEAERNFLNDCRERATIAGSQDVEFGRVGAWPSDENGDRIDGKDDQQDEWVVKEGEGASVGPSFNTENVGDYVRAEPGGSRSQQALSSYVKHQFADLFVNQRNTYLEKEVILLRTRLVDGLASVVGPVGTTCGDKSGTGDRKAGMLRKFMLQKDVDDDVDKLPAIRHDRVESYETMLYFWLRPEVLERFLDCCRDALSRNAKMFRKDDECAGNVLVMLALVHDFLATSVLLPSLSATSNIVQHPATGAPAPAFYKVLKSVHAWIKAYKTFFNKCVLREMQFTTTLRTVLLENLRNFLVRIERAGAKTVERGLDAIMRAVERTHRGLLSKADYLPKDNSLTDLHATQASLALRDLLRQHIGLICVALPPRDVTIIITALAVRMQKFLTSRMKSLRINTSGALILMQDCDVIYDCFATLGSSHHPTSADGYGADTLGPSARLTVSDMANVSCADSAAILLPHSLREIKSAFDNLKQIVSLFLVPPPNLAGLIVEGYLSTQDRNELFLYISMRADFRTHGLVSPWVRSVFSDFREESEGLCSGVEPSWRPSSALRSASPMHVEKTAE